jgi:hypothetical protein
VVFYVHRTPFQVERQISYPSHHRPQHNRMDYQVSYEHSLKSDPGAFIVQVPSQLVDGIPSNIPRALLPEYITELILSRSPTIGKIRNLRIL